MTSVISQNNIEWYSFSPSNLQEGDIIIWENTDIIYSEIDSIIETQEINSLSRLKQFQLIEKYQDFLYNWTTYWNNVLSQLAESKYSRVQSLIMENFWARNIPCEVRFKLLNSPFPVIHRTVIQSLWFLGSNKAQAIVSKDGSQEVKLFLVQKMISIISTQAVKNLVNNIYSEKDFLYIIEYGMEESQLFIIEYFLEWLSEEILLKLAESKHEVVQWKLLCEFLDKNRLWWLEFLKRNRNLLNKFLYSEHTLIYKETQKRLIDDT